MSYSKQLKGEVSRTLAARVMIEPQRCGSLRYRLCGWSYSIIYELLHHHDHDSHSSAMQKGHEKMKAHTLKMRKGKMGTGQYQSDSKQSRVTDLTLHLANSINARFALQSTRVK